MIILKTLGINIKEQPPSLTSIVKKTVSVDWEQVLYNFETPVVVISGVKDEYVVHP